PAGTCRPWGDARDRATAARIGALRASPRQRTGPSAPHATSTDAAARNSRSRPRRRTRWSARAGAPRSTSQPEDLAGALGDAIGVERLEPPASRGHEPLAELGPLEDQAHGLGRLREVARLEQDPRAIDGLADGRGAVRDDRHVEPHRLEQRHAEALV